MAIISMNGGYVVMDDAGQVLGKFVNRERARECFEKRRQVRRQARDRAWSEVVQPQNAPSARR